MNSALLKHALVVGIMMHTCCGLLSTKKACTVILCADVSEATVPEALYEVSVEQAEAEASQASKDAVAERHDSQNLDVALEQGLRIGLCDSKDGS